MSSVRPSVGVFSLQGVRPTMEDEVLAAEKFLKRDTENDKQEHIESESSSPSSPSPGPFSLFCVFDGHGGVGAARFAREHLITELTKNIRKAQNIHTALHNAFIATDDLFRNSVKGGDNQRKPNQTLTQTQIAANARESQRPSVSLKLTAFGSESSDLNDTSGTTAVCCLVDHGMGRIYVANCGDSRCVVIDETGAPLPMSRDHKADRPDEVERIRRAGGFVVHKRVMGELAISRAIGDLDFKEKGFTFVIPDPEIEELQLRPGHKFILIACDGLFDVMTNEMVGEYVHREDSYGKKPQTIVENIVRHAVEDLNTRDNVSAILIRLEYEGGEILKRHEGASQQSEVTSQSSVPSAAVYPLHKVSSADEIKIVSFHPHSDHIESDEDIEGEEEDRFSGNSMKRKAEGIELKFNITEEPVDDSIVEVVGGRGTPTVV